MNNIKFFPFERNNYYKGKLLNTDSFLTEQKYQNDKRRMINRLALGYGVIAGLETAAVDDDRISVESGVAVDGCGREIAVDSPDVKRLCMLNGYDENKTDGSYYLYIAYDEKPVQKVKLSYYGESEELCDKISEGYVLYLSDSESLSDEGNFLKYYKHIETIAYEHDVKVILEVPKFIKTKEKFMLRLKIIPKDIHATVKLKLTIALKCVKYLGKDHIDMEFDSRNAKDTDGEYICSYICQAMNIVMDMAQFELPGESFYMQCGETEYKKSERILLESVITNKDTAECAAENYRMKIMNYINYKPFIDVCIAEIILKDRKIIKISSCPFNQKLLSNVQLAIEKEVYKDQAEILASQIYSNTNKPVLEQDEHSKYEISSGEAVINLGIGGKAGKVFFSNEISHGLGLGNTAVIVGIKDDSRDDCIIYGSNGIFNSDSKGISAEMAVKVDPARGTFIIGLKLTEAVCDYEVTVHWTAVKRKEDYKGFADRKIIINCAAKTLNVMQSVYFTAKFVNMPPSDLHWRVASENGGTINDNGCYTAPSKPGVYKITAVCADDNMVSASAYIVVKP